MALIKFPTRNLVPDETCFALPDPRIEPYALQTEGSVIATQMETGRRRQRLRFTQERNVVQAIFFMSDFQFTYFKGFWTNRLNQGADSFIMNLKIDSDFCDYEVKFVSPYQASFAETGWNVTTTLLIDDPLVLSEDVVCAIDALGNDLEGFFDAVDNFHTLIHTTIPISTPW